MTTDNPLDEAQPGQLITAELWNERNRKTKDYVDAQVAQAKQDIIESGVKRADNADQFDNKTPKNWTDELDKRYAPITHDHEGMASYRRYFKRLEVNQTVVLEHKLGRFPIVDVYELQPVAPDRTPEPVNEKFYLFYHHEERDRDAMFIRDRGMTRWPIGTTIEQILTEYEVQWEDDDSLGDVVNDLLDAFFKPPRVDEMEHRTSSWIDDHREMTIGELKKRDEWPDIRWAMRPEKLVVGHEPFLQEGDTRLIDVLHASYDALAVTRSPAAGPNAGSMDLMILLRS